MEEFFKYFTILLFSIVAANIFGYLIRLLFRRKVLKPTFLLFDFYNILPGIFLPTASFAIYASKGKTVLLIALLASIVIYFLINKVRNLNSPFNNDLSRKHKILDFGIDLLILAIIFLINLYSNLDSQNKTLFPSDGDVTVYSQISQFITLTGYENTFTTLNLIDSQYNGMTLYHYFDLWLNGLITFLFRENNFSTLILITYPFLQFICYQGIKKLFLNLSNKKVSVSYNLGAFLLTFLTGFALINFIAGNKIESSLVFAENIYLRPKVLPIFILNLLAINLLTVRNYFSALLFLCLIPLLYFTSYIMVMGGIALFLLYDFVFKKHLFNNKERNLFIVFYLLINTLFILYFFIFKAKFAPVFTFTLIDLLKVKDFNGVLLSFLSPIIKLLLIIPLLYFPYILLIGLFQINLNKKKTFKIWLKDLSFNVPIILLVTFSFSGVAIWAFLFYSPDSWQLFHNFFISSMALTLIWLIIKSLLQTPSSSNKRIFIFVSILLLILNSIETIQKKNKAVLITVNNEEILTSLQKAQLKNLLNSIESDEEKPILGASIYKNNKYTNIYNRNLLFNRAGYYLKNIRNNVGTVSLNYLGEKPNQLSKGSKNYAYQEVFFKEEHKQSPLYQFIKTKSEERNFTPDEIKSLQLDFIKTYKIRFLITDSTFTFPENSPVKAKATYYNKTTGEYIYSLN
jgi:hypothetical protein